ncbi:MAG: hypothetical protein EXQ95_09395 [Alphaproteobacteria bacterium]|nr:hypothetical protein [Alphaproteobacteria bacterium]
MAAKRRFTISSLIARLVASLALVFSTYNPSGYSLYHWLTAGNGPTPLKVLALLASVILYYAILRVAFGAFRWSGLLAASLVSILLSLLLIPIGLSDHMDASGPSVVLLAQYVAPTSLALVMTFGLSWSHVVQRLAGQLQKRYVR